MSNSPKIGNLKVIDLFAGCGGLSLGFQNAGFQIVAAYDNWHHAINIYKRNFQNDIFNLDLSKLNNDFTVFQKLCPNVIIGSPPCQDFSSAGKRYEDSERNDLSIVFAQIVAEVKPLFFVMENVDRFKNSKQSNIIRHILKSVGYGLTEKVIDASLCGVPQKRKRFFLIGHLLGEDNFLNVFIEKNLSLKSMTVRDYLGDQLGIEYYYRHPRSYARRAIFSIDEPSPTIRGVNRPIPKTYQKHPADPVAVSENVRPLTTLERSYIQTFPETFIFEGTKTDLEQMIGNAVPVNLAQFVAKCLMSYIASGDSDLQINLENQLLLTSR
ncbi:MAG TPA: DNA cytosine methyltransferase [Nostocaceae cyanobacterium]|nr:DNA cytosine methyltransferase [Nostocaceae cyanobacterium]